MQTLFVLTDVAAALRIKYRLLRAMHSIDAPAQGQHQRQLGKYLTATDKHEFATWRVIPRSLIEHG